MFKTILFLPLAVQMALMWCLMVLAGFIGKLGVSVYNWVMKL